MVAIKILRDKEEEEEENEELCALLRGPALRSIFLVFLPTGFLYELPEYIYCMRSHLG